ncbi:MAG: hypothetical protein M3Y72_03890 [Acidobacteriota bacterium]|nr:hypothetical protein [Acidobacteriota bacterium]
MTNTNNALLLTLADLTRSCCAHENYLPWLSNQADKLQNSTAIAHYLALAAEAFEDQAQAQREEFDPLDARDALADILMGSALLTRQQLQVAAAQCIRECRSEEVHA